MILLHTLLNYYTFLINFFHLTSIFEFTACQFGKPVLLEDVPENLDPVLESVLLMQVVKVGGQPCIQVGDNMVALEKGFRLYMTTRLPNPHYPPETCVKINLLNFMATEAGLMDQMLGKYFKAKESEHRVMEAL